MIRSIFPKGEVAGYWRKAIPFLRRIHWPSLFSGAALGIAALHFQTTRPLIHQVHQLHEQVQIVDARLHDLTGAQDGARRANSLLGILASQEAQLTSARDALHAVAELQQAVMDEAERAASSREIVAQLNNLTNRIVALEEAGAQANLSLERIAALQASLIPLGEASANGEARIAEARSVLNELAGMQQQIAVASETLAVAKSVVNDMQGLQERMIAGGEQLEAARKATDQIVSLQGKLADLPGLETASSNAERLITLQQTISSDPRLQLDTAGENAERLIGLQQSIAADERLQLDSAAHNAEALIALQDSLSHQGARIADSVDSLDLLADFQGELTNQLAQLQGVRQQLTELMLLQTALSQTIDALRPLTALSDLRRLDEDEVREVARTILERRRERIAGGPSKYDDATASPEPAAGDRLVPEPPAE